MAICCLCFLCYTAGCNQGGEDTSPSDKPLGSSSSIHEESEDSYSGWSGLENENELPLVPIQ